MNIKVLRDREEIWSKNGTKRITIYNSTNDTNIDKFTVITGFMKDVPDGYFIESFNFDDIDEIRISED